MVESEGEVHVNLVENPVKIEAYSHFYILIENDDHLVRGGRWEA